MVNTFELSRRYYDFAFDNPEIVKPIHGCLYHYIIHLNNKLSWKEKIGLPTYDSMEACGVKNVKTYTNALQNLIEWGFIIMVQKRQNQYTSNIIALVKNGEAPAKAMTKHTPKHLPKQRRGTVTIDKPINYKTNKPINGEKEAPAFPSDNFETLVEQFFLRKKISLNTSSREAIMKMGVIIAFKTDKKDAEYNSNYFIKMYEALEKDEWWKVKRVDLKYLCENFEEAYGVATTKKDPKIKEINYKKKSKYAING
jgi:hypothetical protein